MRGVKTMWMLAFPGYFVREEYDCSMLFMYDAESKDLEQGYGIMI